MKIIPKFQRGGGFEALFTTYVPSQAQAPRQALEQQPTSQSRNTSEEEKGKLTEKDFFNMLKDIDGLPNEMGELITNLTNTFRLSNLTGIDTGDLATTYLSSLYKIRIAAQNKKRYDSALEEASKRGSLAEPAISMDGKLVVQTQDGNISTVSLNTYFQNSDIYHPLTVSNLADLRKYSPQLSNNQSVFDIINNSIGFESFQELLSKVTRDLGTSEVARKGMFSAEGEASKGLALLQTLREDDRIQALGSVTAEGLYTYEIIDKTQLNQIKSLLNYILAVFPDRAKTWAALKVGTPEKNAATKELVLNYLLAGANESHKFDIKYEGSMNHVTSSGKSSSSTSKEEDPKEGFWKQVQSGKGGDEHTFNLLIGKGHMSVDGKLYGAVPGITQNCSLGDYLANSQAGFITKDPKKITFGDVRLSTDSFNDVMVNTSSGAFVVKLPIDQSGQVNFQILGEYSRIVDELKKSGLSESSSEYKQKEAKLLKEANLDALVDQATGLPNPKYFGTFLVLEGLTSGKAYGVLSQQGYSKKYSFDDIKSQLVVKAGDDEQLYDLLRAGLSNKDRGEYKIDGNWFSFNNDTLYRGNIYIPLNMNPLSAMNADSNDVKESTALQYERDYQVLLKRKNQGNVHSNILE